LPSYEDSKKELLKKLDKDSLLVLSGIPGSGKTYLACQYARRHKNERFAFPSHTHSFLSEVSDRLADQDTSHWYGMKRICPLKDENLIQKLMEQGASTRWICLICQEKELQEECEYQEQFKNFPRINIFPQEYLFTTYVEKASPDVIFCG